MGGLKTEAIAVGAAILALAAGACAQVFQPLGYPAGRESSSAEAVSDDGTVVAGGSSRPYILHGMNVGMPMGYRWTQAGGWDATGIDAVLNGVSGDGSTILGQFMVGSANGPGPGNPFYWRAPAGPLPLDQGLAYAASADGSVIVGTRTGANGFHEAYRWTAAGGYQMLGHLSPGPTMESWAAATTPDGTVIAGTSGDAFNQSGAQGFVWTAATGMRPLGQLPGSSGFRVYPRAISADGRYIVGDATGVSGMSQAFVWWEPGGMRPLPLLPGHTSSTATDISADGSVIIGNMTEPGAYTAFVWDRARGMRDLRQVLIGLGATGLEGARLTAQGLSADGSVIAGDAVLPQGPSGAYLARIPAFCYANCDGGTAAPVLNVSDFTCFLTRFAAGDSYTNCDRSTSAPVLNVADFVCFANAFAAGCP